MPEVLDANGDGISDILVFGAYYPYNGTAPAGQPANLMLGKADGTYSVSTSIIPSTFTAVHPREVVQADFNGDGRIDLFVADHGYDIHPFPGAQNKLLLSTAAGGFVDASANLPQVSDFSHSASAADINGDGKLDLFIGNMKNQVSTTESYVLLGDGKGGFARTNAGRWITAATWTAIPATSASPHRPERRWQGRPCARQRRRGVQQGTPLAGLLEHGRRLLKSPVRRGFFLSIRIMPFGS